MSGDAPHLHMLNLIAGGIPASLGFYRRLGDHRAGGRRRPHVRGVEPDTLFVTTPSRWVASTGSTLMRPRASPS